MKPRYASARWEFKTQTNLVPTFQGSTGVSSWLTPVPSPKPGTTWPWSFLSSSSSALSAPSSRPTSTDKFSQCSSTFWILWHWLAHNFEETNYTFITRMRAALYFFEISLLAWLFQTPIRFEMWTERSRVQYLFWQIFGMESLRLKNDQMCPYISVSLNFFKIFQGVHKVPLYLSLPPSPCAIPVLLFTFQTLKM